MKTERNPIIHAGCSIRRGCALLLAVCLLLTLFTAAFAEEEEDGGRVLHVASAEDLISLAENCRLDVWSSGLTVLVDQDIDLGGAPFSPIPTFSGVFDGQGHTISGFILGEDGSHQGFFRYVQEGAVICNLTVNGLSAPEDSRCEVGGIVGVNYGTVENCTFIGKVEGLNYIGGIAGINYGILNNCAAEGIINGKRFTGGICGYSEGLIQACTNRAEVNTTITEGEIELDNINLKSVSDAFNLLNAEDSDVVSDSGGVVGFSKGIVMACSNEGTIGYPHYGYNVGGIAGRQSGYLTGCTNSGLVTGKKDVGGIVGQMEPFFLLKESHALSDELNYLTSLLSQTIANLRDSADNVNSALTIMQSYAGAAVGEVRTGVSDSGVTMDDFIDPTTGQIDYDAYAAAQAAMDQINQEALAADLEGMAADLTYVNAAINDGAHLASEDLEKVNQESNRVAGMMVQAVNGKYSVDLYEDVSDSMTEEEVDGRVSSCVNNGTVEGDTNVGGIAGAMAEEYEFDMDDTISSMISEYVDTSNIVSSTYQSKCISESNVNRGKVSAKKDNAGGIAGYEDVGTITLCENYGNVNSTDGGYVGGIAGRSSTSVYTSYAMCSLDGDEYIGGIVGYGTRIRDCRAIVDMDKVTACFGAIAGYADVTQTDNISGNRFVSEKLGAIDGISYQGYAEPELYTDLLTEENIPEAFTELKLVFTADGEVVKEVPFHYGDSISAAEIPAVPEKDGYTAAWQSFETESLTVGRTVEAVYTPNLTAIATDTVREGSQQPLAVLEGNFTADTEAEITPYEGALPVVENGTVLEAWELTLDSGWDETPEEYTIRYCAPDDSELGHHQELYVLAEDGTWQPVTTETLGSYEAFAGDADGETVFAAVDVHRELAIQTSTYRPYIIGGIAVLVLLILFLMIRSSRRKKKTAGRHAAANAKAGTAARTEGQDAMADSEQENAAGAGPEQTEASEIQPGQKN